MTGGAFHATLVEGLIYVIGWTAFPLAMYLVCEIFGWRERYLGYIVALNWASLFETAIALPVVAATAGSLLPAGIGFLLRIAVFGYFIAYEIFIARRALQLEAPQAVGVVLGGFFLTSLIDAIGDALVYG